MRLDCGMKPLRPIEVDCTGLQEHFRQQYSKFGNTKEQLFHVWRLFQYDENSDTIDSYISKIKQVVALLNYGEPQILGLFKNTLPSKLYWILFPINNLRDTVDAMRRVLMKGKTRQTIVRTSWHYYSIHESRRHFTLR